MLLSRNSGCKGTTLSSNRHHKRRYFTNTLYFLTNHSTLNSSLTYYCFFSVSPACIPFTLFISEVMVLILELLDWLATPFTK